MKRLDLANYIVIIGLILFFMLLIWLHYWNGPIVEGALAIGNARQSNEISNIKKNTSASATSAPAPAPAQGQITTPPASGSTFNLLVNTDKRNVFENDYQSKMTTIVNKINDVYGKSGTTGYNIVDNVIPETDIKNQTDKDIMSGKVGISNNIVALLSELKTTSDNYFDDRTQFKTLLETNSDDLDTAISKSATDTASAISSLRETKQKEFIVDLSIKNTKNILYGYAKRINDIINKIPNKIPEDISIGVIALVPEKSSAKISVDTANGKIITILPSQYSDLRDKFPAFDQLKELVFTSGKWVINMLIPKNPKGDPGPSGLAGAKGGAGPSGEGGVKGNRGVWGPSPA